MKYGAQSVWRWLGRRSSSARTEATAVRAFIVTALAVLASAILIPAAPAAAQETSVDQSIDALLGDHEKFKTVIVALQTAVAAHDAAGVATLVRYPITLRINGKKMVIRSAKDFVKHYDAIVTPEIARAVTEEKYADLFVNSQGVMFGNGEVWLNGICRDSACKTFDVKVITIQDAK
jgi:hypothetical protein